MEVGGRPGIEVGGRPGREGNPGGKDGKAEGVGRGEAEVTGGTGEEEEEGGLWDPGPARGEGDSLALFSGG